MDKNNIYSIGLLALKLINYKLILFSKKKNFNKKKYIKIEAEQKLVLDLGRGKKIQIFLLKKIKIVKYIYIGRFQRFLD